MRMSDWSSDVCSSDLPRGNGPARPDAGGRLHPRRHGRAHGRPLSRRPAEGGRMKILYFTHSLLSCWNHGNAHFLRGVLRDLAAMGHDVLALEPEGNWSLANLLSDHGEAGDRQSTRLNSSH